MVVGNIASLDGRMIRKGPAYEESKNPWSKFLSPVASITPQQRSEGLQALDRKIRDESTLNTHNPHLTESLSKHTSPEVKTTSTEASRS